VVYIPAYSKILISCLYHFSDTVPPSSILTSPFPFQALFGMQYVGMPRCFSSLVCSCDQLPATVASTFFCLCTFFRPNIIFFASWFLETSFYVQRCSFGLCSGSPRILLHFGSSKLHFMCSVVPGGVLRISKNTVACWVIETSFYVQRCSL
jgi:hypothetical protein